MAVHIVARATTLDSIGATMRLRAVAVITGDITDYAVPVIWHSSDDEVVHVSEAGVVTGESEGTATIVARYSSPWGEIRDSVELEVTDAPAAEEPEAPEEEPPSAPERGDAAALPRTFLDTPVPVRTGRVIAVRAGDDLQAAINAAEPGDEVSLEAGATFAGNFYLPNKPGEGWVTIRSSEAHLLPAPGRRVTAADASHMATIASPNAMPAITTRLRAHHYRLIGLEVTTLPSVRRNQKLVEFGVGDSRQSSPDVVPRWLVLDRSWLHGREDLHLTRCLVLNSASSAVVDSRLEWCHGRAQDTQAIIGWNGPGPFKIVNNYLADAAEVIMFGGALTRDPALVPADIEIRRNHIRQSPVMHGGWLVKNIVEIKTARRILIADNVVENVWADGQSGYAFNIKSAGSRSWNVTRDVTIQGNYIADAPGGITVAGRDGSASGRPATNHVVIRGNLFDDIGFSRRGAGRLLLLNGSGGTSMTDVLVEHNTGEARNAAIWLESAPTRRLTIRHNAFGVGYWGVKGSSEPTGEETLARYAPGGVFTGNALVGGHARDYPAGNYTPDSFAEVPAAAVDGVRIGAERRTIEARAAAVRAGR